MAGKAPDETLEDVEKRALREDTPDALTRAVARSKIAAKLFARHEPVKLGRYHLLVLRGGPVDGIRSRLIDGHRPDWRIAAVLVDGFGGQNGPPS